MKQATNEEEEECGICLDALTNPVVLPCSHIFCSECLNGWRSKYGVLYKSKDDNMDRKCPLCRERIPPSKEMVVQLKSFRIAKIGMEARGDVFSQQYTRIKSDIEKLEREIGDWTETIDYSADDNKTELPIGIYVDAMDSNVQKVLNWLGQPPVDKQRLNARNPELDATLVHRLAQLFITTWRRCGPGRC